MKARSCAELAELRSAYVDGALGDADRERLLTHLVDCAACRRDVAELRHVRALLTGSPVPEVETPADLSHRLVSIAGDEATEPLWTRPFRRTGAGGWLPSRRDQLRTRVLAGLLGCGLAALAIVGVGYASAPAETSGIAVDPTAQAITEFTSVVSAFPLDGRVSILQGRAPEPGASGGHPTAVRLPAKKLSEAAAVKVLARAGQAGDEVNYSGTQVVVLTRDNERLSNRVRVASRGGSGTELTPDHPGQLAASVDRYVESDSSTRLVDADLIDRLRSRYTLRGWTGQVYGGRSTLLVEAVEPTVSPERGDLVGVAARWWVDQQSWLLLGQETFDERGSLVVSSRLTELRLDSVHSDPVVASGPGARTTTTLTLSRAADLRSDGWICADRLANLPLLRLSTDQMHDPELVHLVYSDGLTTLSVVEQRGRLSGSPRGGVRNETLAAWVTGGMPLTATWTSGEVVLTVVTDGSRDALVAAVAALPHETRRQPTTMERVRAGWSRILGR